ncbi:hypothetical protein ACH5RR_012392 [Cinchona calisaya]|uniref:Uncharacterized protein n=1 Tax=Cinchona calisaya TaxID=153742 RepID=A0ABD3A7L5_9GENT
MTENSAEQFQGTQSVLMLSDGSMNSPKRESESILVVPNLMKTQMNLDRHPKCQNHTSLKVDAMDIYATSTLDTDIEKGKLETPKSNDEAVGNLKTEDSLTFFQRALQREISLRIGGKFMQLLMNNSLELPKFFPRDKCMTERIFETPTSRSRKFKRSASFNSRRVVFLFSILSSMGTIILIYLTLRVRQIADASSNI